MGKLNLESMSIKDIRTELLYSKEDNIKTMILKKRLRQLVEQKKSLANLQIQQKSKQNSSQKECPSSPILSKEYEQRCDEILSNLLNEESDAEDEDYRFLEEFVGNDEHDDRAVQYDPQYEWVISRDMANNKMTERIRFPIIG